jgi:phosphoribosylformylglycinamidine cyclo-ligase
MRRQKKAYAAAGVDIDLGNRLKATLPALLASTHRREVLGRVGGFGGLFALDLKRHRQPVLVASVDGVGTKLKIAFAMDRHDTVGQDLVNHCVNDIAVLGAEPLFFLDYLGTGRLAPRVFDEILRGFATACAENRCALIGGETAQMPGFYQTGEYDVSGTIIGIVEKALILDGRRSVRSGDVAIGIASSGLHTNGYSLARRIFFEQLRLNPRSHVAELSNTIGDELLKVHVSYGPLIQQLLKRFNGFGRAPRAPSRSTRTPRKDRPIRAFAHITGGGFIDNLPRVLPERCDVVIRKGSWEMLPIFRLIRERGRIEEEELYHVFNMGIGMVALVHPAAAARVLAFIRRSGHKAWPIGEVIPGTGRTLLQ